MVIIRDMDKVLGPRWGVGGTDLARSTHKTVSAAERWVRYWQF
jgi:hypothetical protein